MGIFDKFCYSLLELAARWRCTENDIINMAVAGKLRVWANIASGFSHDTHGPLAITGLHEVLLPSELSRYLPNEEEPRLSLFRSQSNPENYVKILARDTKEQASLLMPRALLAVMAAEVERMEAEHPELLPPSDIEVQQPNDDKPGPCTKNNETDIELVQRLKLEGLGDKLIAHRLKDAFPKITPSRIGRLITQEPGVYVETETYRGRGRSLLK